ncbi:hypothetical protein [Variovorax boronicumulans]|uniref:hypothetical protein n=1 Tax=Variovorax boronicumulans TaxID=436515 RepID=UPI002789B44F|nr:hypothetical protein [Variovorax boronicumulans]MDQ0039623.1 hypothetical protein [Variovorax boronicumulans]
MPTLILVSAAALLLALNVWMTRRALAIDEVPLRKNLLVTMVWIVPFLGAFVAWTYLPRSPRDPANIAPPSGFVTEAAPAEITLGGAPAFSLLANTGTYDGLPLLDWQALGEWASSQPDPERRREATALGKRAWLLHLKDALGPDFHLYESEQAWVLSSLEHVVAVATAAYVTSTRKRIQKVLAGVAVFEEDDRSILLVMDDDETYYSYVSSYYPEQGEFAFSGGMFINAGCPHFLAKRADLSGIEPVIAHEMTHSALSHLGLPRWLDEGLAVNTERQLAGAGPATHTPQELRRKHLAFWGEAEIQEFWSGESFFRTDDGNLLSYELARILVELLAKDWAPFAQFVSTARSEDGGAEAAGEVFEADLGALACALLEREADPRWSPAPETWFAPRATATPA